jgi:hypothetical protein
MALDIQIIHSRNFLQMTPAGQFDSVTSKEMLVQIAVMVKIALVNDQPSSCEILLDVRKAFDFLKGLELVDILKLILAHRSSPSRKLAILTRDDSQLGRAHLMEFYATNRGSEIGSFADYEEAIDWLTHSAELVPCDTKQTVPLLA